MSLAISEPLPPNGPLHLGRPVFFQDAGSDRPFHATCTSPSGPGAVSTTARPSGA